MDAKQLAMIIGIGVLLPLFLGFFVDAVYTEPKYENYCNNSIYSKPYREPVIGANCTDFYSTTEAQMCSNDKGMPIPKYDSNNCQVYDSCDYCQRDYDQARGLYNRDVFFILAPLGLVIVIIGIYLTVQYIGAGLMFGGLATMFYATVRYFSDMSKLLRALVLLVELLVIIYIGYKKIEDKKQSGKSDSGKKKRKR
jgi:hypothetical protein